MLQKLRSALFNALFLTISIGAALLCLPLTLSRSRRPVARVLRRWAKTVVVLMRRVAGISVEIRGREHLPQDAPHIIAGKHQSECDGIIVLSLIPDLAVIAMKELADKPLIGPILRKLEMVLVDTCGGGRERESLLAGGRAARAAGRSILIYPEGHLMAVGTKERYRPGVYHLAVDLGLPVIPVATNVGLRWDRRQKLKKAGPAVVQFLPALPPHTDKGTFMARLEEEIERATELLVLEHQAV